MAASRRGREVPLGPRSAASRLASSVASAATRHGFRRHPKYYRSRTLLWPSPKPVPGSPYPLSKPPVFLILTIQRFWHRGSCCLITPKDRQTTTLACYQVVRTTIPRAHLRRMNHKLDSLDLPTTYSQILHRKRVQCAKSCCPESAITHTSTRKQPTRTHTHKHV